MRKLIFILSFFSYSGYYIGLALLFAFNLGELSRFYSLPLRILLLLGMLYVIKENVDTFKKNKNSFIIPLFLIFWCFYFFKVLYTENTVMSGFLQKEWFEYIFYSLAFSVFPFLAFFTVDLKNYKQTIIDGFIFSGFLLGVLSAYLYGDFLVSGIGRINLATEQTGQDVLNPLSLSYSGALTIILCLYKLVIVKVSQNISKIYLLAAIVLSFVMFLLGSSRGSVIAIFLTLPLIIKYSSLKQKFFLTSIIILSIPVIIWAVVISGSNIFERILDTKKDGAGGRNVLWSDALNHFFEYPIAGGNIEVSGIYPHNIVLEILMATGIIGALLILPILIKGFLRAFLMAKKNPSNLFVLIILIQGLVQNIFSGSFTTATLVYIPLAIAMSYEEN